MNKRLKIAFVNQPFDTIIPPFQNSVGACTYGVLPYLGRSCDIVVYGIEDFNRDRETAAFGGKVSFRFFPSTPADRLLHSLRIKSSKLVQFSAPLSTSSWFFPAFGRQVAMDLSKQQCDVIHVQHSSQYIPIIREFNPQAKIVLHLHAEWFSQSRFEVLRRRLQSVDLLTCVSNYVAEKTKRNFPAIADRCETTYNGIEPKEFSREKDYESARRRKEKRILFAGAVSPQKGPHVLLDAFNLVAGRCPDVRLDFVGSLDNYPLEESFDLADRQLIKSVAPFYARDRFELLKTKLSLASQDAGTYQSYLKKRLPPEIAGKVSFHGHVGVRQDLIDWYYDADVLAFPPIWDEGFGLPPVEAMASGTPVVATRSGAVLETVDDGVTGLWVDKNDSKALAEALLRLLQDDDLREKMGREARHRMLEHFTWQKVAERMFIRYAALCGLSVEAMIR